MQKEIPENVKRQVQHLGQEAITVRSFYMGQYRLSTDGKKYDGTNGREAEAVKLEIIDIIKKSLENPDQDNQDLRDYLSHLIESDWSTIDGFKAFLKIHNLYTGWNLEINENPSSEIKLR
jgi:hypothetical protein